MNIDALRRRIDRMIAAIDRPRQHVEFDISSLNQDEQASFSLFLSTCPQPFDVRSLTDQQLDMLLYWSELIHALQSGNQDTASRCRRWLSWSCNELLVRFRAIRPVKNASYPFNELGYDILASKIEQQRMTASDWQAVREWCELSRQQDQDQAG